MKLTNRPSTIGELGIISTANEELDKQAALIAALLAACQATVENCEACDKLGYIETYPPHSADAYNGCGDPIIDIIDCPVCSLARAALALVGGHTPHPALWGVTVAEFETVVAGEA